MTLRNPNIKLEDELLKPDLVKLDLNQDPHLELEITIEIFDYKTPFKIESNLEHRWINKNQIHNYGLPKPIKTIIDNHVC